MNTEFDKILPDLVQDILQKYNDSDLLLGKTEKQLPVRSDIIDILNEFKELLFPGYFSAEQITYNTASFYIGQKIAGLHHKLAKQIALALAYEDASSLTCNSPEIKQKAEALCCQFFQTIPTIQESLLLDVQAGYDGDPAADSREQIIFSYPGFYAILVYRIAHELYKLNVPFIPRIMTEQAHSKTGIDINAGATIGTYFFMDHGTGIVIGETTVIGNYVKLYQGVTLGALSTRGGQHLSGVRRHPTIGDRVTIYSNATILGGETVIGADSVIGGGAFITSSIPPHTRVSVTPPELAIKNDTHKNTTNTNATQYVYEI
ncbi:MAG: serine acetyltransferase [Eubacteriales bacterium]|nr:serine acetyltransferase [Eubacteriales bacterium]